MPASSAFVESLHSRSRGSRVLAVGPGPHDSVDRATEARICLVGVPATAASQRPALIPSQATIPRPNVAAPAP